MSEIAAEGAEPISAEIRETLLSPFIAATGAALGEMASTEVVVRAVSRGPGRHPAGNLRRSSDSPRGSRAPWFSFFRKAPQRPSPSAVLAHVATEVDAQLIRDCVGEIGNVVAGQAKALLAGTSYHFTFSLPKVVDVEDFQPPPVPDCLVVAFNCDSGEFALELFLKLYSD